MTRPKTTPVGYEMTLEDLWYMVAKHVFIHGFIEAGGIPVIDGESVINTLTEECYVHSEEFLRKGPYLASTSYKDLYERIQSEEEYTEEDYEEWVDNTWGAITESVTRELAYLTNPDTSFLPDNTEMYNLEPSVVLGVLWSIAYIPSNPDDASSDHDDNC